MAAKSAAASADLTPVPHTSPFSLFLAKKNDHGCTSIAPLFHLCVISHLSSGAQLTPLVCFLPRHHRTILSPGSALLNPTANATYALLRGVFADVFKMFPDAYVAFSIQSCMHVYMSVRCHRLHLRCMCICIMHPTVNGSACQRTDGSANATPVCDCKRRYGHVIFQYQPLFPKPHPA